MGRRAMQRELYARTPTASLAPIQVKEQLRPNRSIQIEEPKACAQRVMIKYNLAPEEATKYQQFIRLLSTFESSKAVYYR